MDINDLIGTVITVVFFITFLGIVWWAYGSSRKSRFEEDGKIPFEEIDDLPPEKKSETKNHARI